MKNVFLTFCLIAFCLSCSDDVDSNYIKADGVIVELSSSYYQYGTHLLLTDNKEDTLYALKSSTVDLDDFINDKVEVTGLLLEEYPLEGGPEYMDVKDIQSRD